MNILVTGGAGFIGSNLCERLITIGHTVICWDNYYTSSEDNIRHLCSTSRFQFVWTDVRYANTFHNDQRIDQIFHLACPASPVHYQRDPVRTILTAVDGTAQILDYARRTNARILIASTSEVYGDPREHPQREDYWGNVNPIGPRACYDEGKRCAEALAVSYVKQYGLSLRIARIFNTYGPKMQKHDGRVVSNFIVNALENQPLKVYGDGSQTRSFCYVQDLIDGLLKLMALDDDPGPVNLGNPDEISIHYLAERVIQLTGSHSTIECASLPQDDPVRRKPDITKAISLLGWQPSIDIVDGLSKTIDYFSHKMV